MIKLLTIDYFLLFRPRDSPPRLQSVSLTVWLFTPFALEFSKQIPDL